MRGPVADKQGAATLDVQRETWVTEEDAIASVQRERDQRQLISFLVANADDFTKKVVKSLPSYAFNYTSLGKATGVYHSKVSRALIRLAGKYDGNRFGDISDYMTA